ncbi:tyrosine-protein kinase Lyn-like isoform X2 [Mercenaria mercenaria]|uniref:tyrosine-protein kinase Lyn-like isoform X2 n=1 Tax=Mercenaria mercenaria TaxID=6596 RepID=UPI00234ED80A|nr:tyrosine-protein kinase Lyn-like isoform X2 [Mercenaria mercenaria]
MEESDTDRKKKWKLKKINKCWFLDVGGKLTRMNILNNANDVYMEDNIIFADDLVFQLIEECDNEITVTEIKDVCRKDKTSEYKKNERYLKREKESGARNNADKKESEEPLRKESDRNEDMSQNTHQNRSCRAELTFVEDPDDDETWSDSDREINYELGSDDYVPKKGKLRGLFKRIKQIVKKKSATKQKEEPLYEDISNNSKELTPRHSGSEDEYDYTLFVPLKTHSVSSDAVSGVRIVTAIFDFNQFSEDEISFKKQDKLTLRGETLSGNSDWCFAEHLTTGKKGYIPSAYVTEDIRALEAQVWWHDISREGAEALLNMSDGSLGTYLLRPSDRGRMFVLSMLVPDKEFSRARVAHIQIKSHSGRLYISLRRHFTDIFDLIHFYKCTADELPCKLKKPAPRKNPVVYPRKLELERESVTIIKSVKVGEYGELFTGKLFNTFDVTIVTKCKLAVDHFLTEAKDIYTFQHSRHFVRMLAVIIKPEPFMIVLGETVRCTLQTYLRRDRANTITLKSLTKMAIEIADGMAFLEKEKIVHRHLNAENVFVCELNELKIVHPKLPGLMKASGNDKHLKGENEWRWTAPEAIADEDKFSAKSDVWSFGVLLYELITFGKTPYAGLVEEDTIRRLHEGFRLPEPKGGPKCCPVAFYVTMLECWHRRPECRPTFDFLGEFLHDFNVAVESEIRLERADIQDVYKKGTLTDEEGPNEVPADLHMLTEGQESSEEQADLDMHTYVNVSSIIMPDKRIDSQKSQKSEQNIGTTAQTPLRNNSGKPEITGGFDVKVLFEYEAEEDYEISIYSDDIITNVDPADGGWWIGTTANGTRGLFPSNFVEIFENTYAEVTKL